jgi:GT2 family glycosyltransferase
VNQCDVVIVNFNAGLFLKDAVTSVAHSPAVSHVYIVDNGSTDASIELLDSVRDDRLVTIRNDSNLGFAAGCNIGLARATAESVLLLNPDCRVVDGGIERLVAALRSGDRVGMVGPLLLSPDGSEQVVGRRRFPTPGIVFAQTFGSSRPQPLPKQPIGVEAISGACMMVRRAAATAVGPMDEAYFLHFEDLDWCMRFRQRGWDILFVPDAKVTHQGGISSRTRPFAVEYYKHRGIIRFYQKFLSDAYSRWQMVLMIIAVWSRFAGVALWRLLSSRG